MKDIMTITLQSRHTKATIVTVCALTAEASDVEKDEFYEQCQDVLPLSRNMTLS